MIVSKHFQVSVRRAGEWVTRDMDFRRAQQQNNFQFVSPLLDNLMFRDLQIFLLQIHHLHKYFLLYHNHQFHELIRFLLKKIKGVFKGSPAISFFEFNDGKRRIRESTTLNLNDIIDRFHLNEFWNSSFQSRCKA